MINTKKLLRDSNSDIIPLNLLSLGILFIVNINKKSRIICTINPIRINKLKKEESI